MNEIVKHEEKTNMPTMARTSAIIPTDLSETWKLAEMIKFSGMAPRGMEKQESIATAIIHGLEVGMTPMVALQSIAVVNGHPTIWGDGAIGLVRGSGKLEAIEETFEGEPYKDNYTAICRVKRKGEDSVIEGRFSVAQAKKANLWNKTGKNGQPTPWVQYPDRMLKMRARAFALRDGFADVLRGLSIREEVMDYPSEPEQRRGGNSIFDRARERQQDVETSEGFDAASIQDQLKEAQSADPDVIDAEEEQPEPEEQETSENAPEEQEELSDEQKGLLKEIEESFSGCRTLVELDRELSKYNDDVKAGGDAFMAEANKLYFGRRAEIGGK